MSVDVSNVDPEFLKFKPIDALCTGYFRKALKKMNKGGMNYFDIGAVIVQYFGFLIYIAPKVAKYPYRVSDTPFVSHSIDKEDFDSPKHKEKLLTILGGRWMNETAFQSFYCSNKFERNVYYNIILSNKHIYLPNNNYDTDNGKVKLKVLKKNNYRHINIKQGSHTLSFLIENNNKYGNCIVIISACDYYDNGGDTGYNVYSVDKDEWLLAKNLDAKKLLNESQFDTDGARALLFDQNVLVISHYAKLYFVDLSNLVKPKLIGTYDLS